MSAQAYTNKLRVLAEAAVTKVQYPGRIALNKNPILSTINCSPNFSIIDYVPIPRCCVYSPPLTIICVDTLDGGMSQTIAFIAYDGNCLDTCYVLSGGNSNTTTACENTIIMTIVFDCGNASTDSTTFLSV
jgi:hypothetical protein